MPRCVLPELRSRLASSGVRALPFDHRPGRELRAERIARCAGRRDPPSVVSAQPPTTTALAGKTPLGGALSARVSWTEAAQRGSLAAKAATVETGHRGDQRDLSVTCRRLRVKTLRDGKWSVLQDNRVVTSLDGRTRATSRGPRPAGATACRAKRHNRSSPFRARSVARRSLRGDLIRRVGCHIRVNLRRRAVLRSGGFSRSGACTASATVPRISR